jgi:hypothetical protein
LYNPHQTSPFEAKDYITCGYFNNLSYDFFGKRNSTFNSKVVTTRGLTKEVMNIAPKYTKDLSRQRKNNSKASKVSHKP